MRVFAKQISWAELECRAEVKWKIFRGYVMPGSGDITQLLAALRTGDEFAREELIARVYIDLRRIARRQMGQEVRHHSLQPTELVHEAYRRLLHNEPIDWKDRAHFFAQASRTMRNILIDHARARLAGKRGGGVEIVVFDDTQTVTAPPSVDVLAVEDALQRLEGFDPRKGRIVEMRFYSGMTEEEIAEVLSISVRTVKRDWRLAKAWLHHELSI